MIVWAVAAPGKAAAMNIAVILDFDKGLAYRSLDTSTGMTEKMVTASHVLDRVLVLEMVRVTEAAAVAASKLIGRGDEKAADHAAVEAMRAALNTLEMDGTVVIGEAPTGSDALSAERCIRLCQSQVGVNLDMVIKFAEGIGRLLQGDD